MQKDAKLNIYAILSDQMMLLDFAGPITVFSLAQNLGANINLKFIAPIDVLKLMPEHANSPSISNLAPLPDNVEENSLIMLFGASNTDLAMNSQINSSIIEWLEARKTEDHQFFSVCVGALFLAKAGILKGKNCTTFHGRIEDLKRLSPSAKVAANQIFVHDENIYSSAGVTTGIDLALYYVERHYGAKLAYQIAREMVVYTRRTPKDPQISPYLLGRNHMKDKIHQIQDAICHDPQHDWKEVEVSEDKSISKSTLRRDFLAATHMSFKDYLIMIRIAYAKQLMCSGYHNIEEVAYLSGFNNSRTMRRQWQDKEHCAPKAWQQQFTNNHQPVF